MKIARAVARESRPGEDFTTDLISSQYLFPDLINSKPGNTGNHLFSHKKWRKGKTHIHGLDGIRTRGLHVANVTI
ncbi:MAG TPA: hypothetical protein PK445_06290, partial [Methanolinea sp.]|nr:hypothetical protein [Methanolinea sp.]HQJ19098.1 hypothetical protein [Methanolinea sp.]